MSPLSLGILQGSVPLVVLFREAKILQELGVHSFHRHVTLLLLLVNAVSMILSIC